MATDQTLSGGRAALSLEQEFLALTLLHLKRYPLPVALVFFLISVFAFSSVGGGWVTAWFVLSCAMLGLRVALLRAVIPMQAVSTRHKMALVYLLNAGNGVALGLSVCFFPFLSDLERAVQTILISGLGIGVVASNAGVARATLPYLFLTVLPLSLVWLMFPSPGEPLWKSIVVAMAFLMFLGLLITIARDNHRLFSDAVKMRLEYASINEKLEKALAESEASNAAKTRFLAAASHDLRQPVHTLSLLTAALMSRKLDDRTAEISHTMDQSLQSLARQLDELLDISKLDAGIVVPEKSVVNLELTLARLSDDFYPIANQKHLSLSVHQSGAMAVYTDPTLLERVLRNIIGNAIKYTDAGEVTVAACDLGEVIEVVIADTGIGIAADTQDLIFEEFYQVSNPHRKRSQGLGLGLSIVRRLVPLLDIDLSMISEPGKGSRFRLTIPASPVNTAPMEGQNRQQPSFEGAVVLVVDDEEDIRIATRAYLQTLECEVLLAETSDDAIELARQRRPDLLVVDFRLADNDSGLEAISGVRRIHADTPAIIVTGDTAPDRLREAVAAEARLLHKPIDTDELKRAMEELLSSKV